MNEMYEAPVMEVLNVTIERGFAVSDTGSTDSGVGFGGTGEDVIG